MEFYGIKVYAVSVCGYNEHAFKDKSVVGFGLLRGFVGNNRIQK